MTEAIDLCELVERYDNDQKCRNYLEHLRWRDGVRVIFRKRSATRNLAHWQKTLQPDLAEKACAG